MEILKLESLDRMPLADLKIEILSLSHLPTAHLIRVAEEKGVVPNDKMIQLRIKFD